MNRVSKCHWTWEKYVAYSIQNRMRHASWERLTDCRSCVDIKKYAVCVRDRGAWHACILHTAYLVISAVIVLVQTQISEVCERFVGGTAYDSDQSMRHNFSSVNPALLEPKSRCLMNATKRNKFLWTNSLVRLHLHFHQTMGYWFVLVDAYIFAWLNATFIYLIAYGWCLQVV